MFLDQTSSAILAAACVFALIFLARGRTHRGDAENHLAAAESDAEGKAQAGRAYAVWDEVKGLVGVYLVLPATIVSREWHDPLEKFAYEAGIVYYVAQQKLPQNEAGLLIARYAVEACGADARAMFSAFEAMDPARRGTLMRMAVDDLSRAMEAARAGREASEAKM